MKKVYFETYGCSHNFADTVYMKNRVSISNEVTADIDDADIVVVNTCAVKDRTAYNFKKRLRELEAKGKKIVIAGCLSQASKKTNFAEVPRMTNYSMIGPNNLADINLAIESDSVIQKLEGKKRTSQLDYHTHNPVEIVPISTGCLSACTFCQTKLARGNLMSFSPEEIIARVKDAVSHGTKIIYLTSQDNGCYGFDLKTNLAELVTQLCEIEGDFRIRVGMGNPIHLRKIQEPLLKAMKHPKVFKFLHIPIQAGSNKVLKDMIRGNTIEEMNDLISYCQTRIPKCTIATDIIVGFPTESKEAFMETINWVNEWKPAVTNRAKYSPRPGTRAATMDVLSTNEMTRRSKLLTKAVEASSKWNNEQWIGWSGPAIVETVKKEGSCVARNDFYKPIVLKGNFTAGEHVTIEVTGCTTWHLKGKQL